MDNTELIPEKGSEGVGIAITEMLEEILTYRDELKFSEKCVRYYKLRRNEHWKYENKDLNLLSANLLGSHHQKTVNMLTDNSPTFNAVPGGEIGDDAKEKLSLLENMTDSWWIDTEQQSLFEESVHVGELYGTVGEEVYFDVKSNFPTGEIATKIHDPLYISLYPPKCRKVEQAEAVLTWEPMSVRKAKREWPDVADQIQGDISLLEKIGDDRETESSQNKKATQTVLSSITRWISKTERKPRSNATDDLFVITCWAKDYSEKDGKPVYPGNIRRIRCTNGGNVVLDDEYNPSLNPELPEELHQANYLYNRFPHSYTQPVIDPASPFGMADFEQLEKLNVEFNKTMTQFALFKDKTSRPKLLNPKDSGITNQELDNMVGIARPTNYLVGQAIKYIDPPSMNADIMTGLNLYKDLFNEIAGSFNDVMQGQKNGSEVIAAKAIAMLLEEASRMARGKIRNYSKMLRERGRMFVALAQNWYSEPRFITFQVEGKDQTQPVTRDMLQIAGKINIVSGSTMPVSAIQRREEVLALAQGGLVDQEYVLEKFNIDGYQDIIKRMQAGPLGQYIQKLSLIGIPPPLLDLFKQIGQMDEKDIQKGLEMGKLPQFMQIVQAMSGQQQPQPPDPEMMKVQAELQIKGKQLEIDGAIAQADIQAKNVSAQKTLAEIELIKQKIETEIVERQVKIAGVEFDKDLVRIKKAEAIANIKNTEKYEKIDAAKTIAGLYRQKQKESMDLSKGMGAYSEKGMESNNEEPAE